MKQKSKVVSTAPAAGRFSHCLFTGSYLKTVSGQKDAKAQKFSGAESSPELRPLAVIPAQEWAVTKLTPNLSSHRTSSAQNITSIGVFQLTRSISRPQIHAKLNSRKVALSVFILPKDSQRHNDQKGWQNGHVLAEQEAAIQVTRASTAGFSSLASRPTMCFLFLLSLGCVQLSCSFFTDAECVIKDTIGVSYQDIKRKKKPPA